MPFPIWPIWERQPRGGYIASFEAGESLWWGEGHSKYDAAKDLALDMSDSYNGLHGQPDSALGPLMQRERGMLDLIFEFTSTTG